MKKIYSTVFLTVSMSLCSIAIASNSIRFDNQTDQEYNVSCDGFHVHSTAPANSDDTTINSTDLLAVDQGSSSHRCGMYDYGNVVLVFDLLTVNGNIKQALFQKMDSSSVFMEYGNHPVNVGATIQIDQNAEFFINPSPSI